MLSTTALKDAAICLKYYQYKHIEHLTSRPSDLSPRMRRGTWIHRALEYDAHGKDYGLGLTECYTWAIQHGADAEKANGILDECYRILKGYFEYYAHQPYWKWTTLWAERTLRYTLSSGIVLQATPDRMVEWRGRPWLVEQKTTIEVPSPTWRGIDPQTALQLVLCHLNDIPVDGVIFDYLVTREPMRPRVKKDGRFYAVSADGHTSSAAFEQAVPDVLAAWKHDSSCGAFAPDGSASHTPVDCTDPYIESMRVNMVNDGQFYQRFEVYRAENTISETLRDAAGIARTVLQAERAGHYPRIQNVLYCTRYCDMSSLCASEYIAGRPLEVMRETDYVIDNPDDREGRGDIA